MCTLSPNQTEPDNLIRKPSLKGTSVIPVVLALKQQPDPRKLVPERLWKYFDKSLLVSSWYPEEDFWILIEALANAVDPATIEEDVWRVFARSTAQRDLGEEDVEGFAEETSGSVGIYRVFASKGMAPESFFRRVIALWSQYHDTGRLEVMGGSREKNSVRTRLTGLAIPIEGFVRSLGYYLEKYGRIVGIKAESTVLRSTAKGDAYCEWEVRLGRTPATEAYVAALLTER